MVTDRDKELNRKNKVIKKLLNQLTKVKDDARLNALKEREAVRCVTMHANAADEKVIRLQHELDYKNEMCDALEEQLEESINNNTRLRNYIVKLEQGQNDTVVEYLTERNDKLLSDNIMLRNCLATQQRRLSKYDRYTEPQISSGSLEL